MSTLKEKTAKGLGWGFVDNILGAGFTAVVSIILARLLTPEDFGLIGAIALFTTLGNTLMDSGFSGALIRKPDVDDKDLSTVFYTNLAIGGIIYAILYFAASPIASYLNKEILEPLVRVMALSVIILSFTQVQKVTFIRKIDFRTQAIISLSASLASGIISIWMALGGWGVWSLAAQQLVKQGATSILLWVFSNWKPSLVFSMKSFREMFNFGSKLLACSLLSVIWNEIYSFAIGKLNSPVQVGFFARAEKFKSMVTSNIGQVVQRVGYPVMSTIQDDPQRQVRVYRKITRLTILLTSTLLMGLLGCADAMVEVLIGAKWLPSVEYLRILGLSGIFLPLILGSVNVFNANGKSGITLTLEVIKTLLAAIPVTLGIIYDIKMMLWGMAGVSVVSYLVHAAFVSREIPYTVWQHIQDIVPYMALGAFMGATVYWTGTFIEGPALLVLAVQLITGFVVTVACYELIYRSQEYKDVRNEALKLLGIKK